MSISRRRSSLLKRGHVSALWFPACLAISLIAVLSGETFATAVQCGGGGQPTCLSGLSLPANRCVDYGYRLDDPNSAAPLEIAGATDHGFGVSHCARYVALGMQLNYVALQAQRPTPADSTAELRVYANDNLAFGDLRPGILLDAVAVTLPGAITATDFVVVELDTTYDTTPYSSVWLELYFPSAPNPCMGTRVQVTPGVLGEGIVAVHEAFDSSETWEDYQNIAAAPYLNRVPVLRPLHLLNCAPCYVNVVPTGGNLTSEDGDSVEIECMITAVPTDTVFVDIITTAPGEGLASVTQLIFTQATAPIPQYFWVVGQDDAVQDGDSLYHVRGTASSNDACYDGEIGQSSLTNIDNDIVFIETVPVGDANNAADVNGYGSVGYDYEISKYEITNEQWVACLNAVGSCDINQLFDPSQAVDPMGGIILTGGCPNKTYTTKPDMANKPVNFITLHDAMRFCNWLHNGMPVGDQDSTTTEDGAYDMTSPVGGIYARKPGAKWAVATVDELYKAAFYDPLDPAADGNGTPDYWLLPTSSDASPPTKATATASGDVGNPGANVVNYGDGAIWNGVTGNLTTVGGAGPLSVSHYGTYDQGGNVAEWTEDQFMSGGFILAPLIGSHSDFPDPPESNVGFFSGTATTPSQSPYVGLRVVKLDIGPTCSCGDANGDGFVSIGDAVFIINYIFGGGPAPCNGDADNSGTVSIGDAVAIINFIFAGGPAPSCP